MINNYIEYIFQTNSSDFIECLSNFFTILVNLSILWIFWKSYFSKNLKVLSVSSGSDKFFGKNITITIQNRSLRTFVIDKIVVVLKNGDQLQLDYSKQDINLRTIEMFKRINLEYKFSDFMGNKSLFLFDNINRFEIICGPDVIMSYYQNKKLFGIINRKIKKNKIIGFSSYLDEETIISTHVKYLIKLFNDRTQSYEKIYVTDYGFANKTLYYKDGDKIIPCNAFEEKYIRDVDIFYNYLKDNFFNNNEKWSLSLLE